MRRARLVSLCIALSCAAGCSGGGGGGGSGNTFADYCALAGLPAKTSADLELLQRHSSAAQAHHRGKLVGETASNAAVVRAALELNLAIAPALGELRALGTQEEPSTGTPPTVAAVVRAQAELRTACGR